ncbi:hypothetical protein ACF1G0_32975 [Streptomyces sp. NPDC013953]|uniref:hypothetical protein n=1 Tax=Streptomyces sp. NPDC013953 TaxID=3364868 RepID=UPI0037026B80
MYDEVRSGRIKWATYKLDDHMTMIVPDHASDGDYDAFLEALPSGEDRYAVFNFGEINGRADTVVFYHWSPDRTLLAKKMLYASSRADFRDGLEGVAADISASNVEEASREAVLARVN